MKKGSKKGRCGGCGKTIIFNGNGRMKYGICGECGNEYRMKTDVFYPPIITLAVMPYYKDRK